MTAPTSKQVSSEPALPQAPKTEATGARAVGKKSSPSSTGARGRIRLHPPAQSVQNTQQEQGLQMAEQKGSTRQW